VIRTHDILSFLFEYVLLVVLSDLAGCCCVRHQFLEEELELVTCLLSVISAPCDNSHQLKLLLVQGGTFHVSW